MAAQPALSGRSRTYHALTRWSVQLACLATIAVHLLSLTRRLGVDEGGFAMVASHWHDGGPWLYGPSWVDRPPGLIAVFAAAEHLGPYGVRLAATGAAVILVLAVSWAARTVGGRGAARWAAWTAFGFASSALLDAQQLNGELVAASLVSLSVACLLSALHGPQGRRAPEVLAVVAGVSATTAVLLKQDFIDGLTFAAVLLALTWWRARSHRDARAVPGRLVAGLLVGASAPVAVAALWAASTGGIGPWLYAIFGFRSDAAQVISTGSWKAPGNRLEILLAVAVLSGLLVLLAQLFLSRLRRLKRPAPLPWAMVAATVVELFGVAAGESYWRHYLLGLVPMVALGAGLSVGGRRSGWRRSRLLVISSVIVTAVASPTIAIAHARSSSNAYTTGRWLAESAAAGDTLVVPLSHANVVEAAGLRPGYPYSWSLPARTLDPQLHLLARTLNGPAAPTWVVRWDPTGTWSLDPKGTVDKALRTHYRTVATVCGHPVWLHRGDPRSLAAVPAAGSCDAGSP